jgi:hypothetical protein
MAFIINPFMVAPSGPQSPTDLANLVRWYKADSLSLADGTAVGNTGTEWTDSTGSGNSLTQATAARRPIFKTNIFGSKPAVQFISANQYWLSMPVLTMANPFTIVIVGITGSSIILGHDTLNMQVRAGHAGNNLFIFDGGASVDSVVCTTPNTSVRAETWRSEDAVGSIFFRDGKIDVTAGGNTGAVSLSINTMSDPQFGLHINGYIAEVCIWSQNQINADMDALYDNYFKPRWGLP